MNRTNCSELANSCLLVKPKKKNTNFPEYYPFPIVHDSSEENAAWHCAIGYIKECCVEVTDEKDIELFFTKGFFGKGTLSRSTPQALENKLRGSRKTKKSKQRGVGNSARNKVSEKNVENSSPPLKKEEIEVVLSDTDNLDEEENDSSLEDVGAITSKGVEKEVLQLSFEEAYFLSYGLGALVVKDKDQPLDLMRLWHKFCELHPSENFPVMYTAYHHFRSKGWVVRSGMKYGADFALYKDGPPFYHSSYVVIVKPVKEQNLRDIATGGRPNLTWSSLAGLNRMCSHVSKAVIILYVIKPSTISENKISTPHCISQYKLEEVLVNRWVPSSDRADVSRTED